MSDDYFDVRPRQRRSLAGARAPAFRPRRRPADGGSSSSHQGDPAGAPELTDSPQPIELSSLGPRRSPRPARPSKSAQGAEGEAQEKITGEEPARRELELPPTSGPLSPSRARLDDLLAAGGASRGPAGPQHIVTAVEYQQRRKAGARAPAKDRVNVFLDGRYAFALSEIVVADAGLRRGLAIGEAEVERLRALDADHRAYESALTFLSFRPRGEAEVRRNLVGKDFAPEQIDAALERLRKIGLLNDAAFARYWVENRDAFSPRGPRALKAELRQRGVSDEVVAEALDTGRDNLASARTAAEKKARQLSGLDHKTFRERLGGYLARRGFDYDTIKPVVEECWLRVSAAD